MPNKKSLASVKQKSPYQLSLTKRGFTLVELTVVLVIISILATLGMGALSAFLVSVNYSVTKKKQEVIKDALVAYFGANKRLPCPETGVAPRAGNETVGCSALTPVVGTVPWVTLGLPKDAAEDGWANMFTYRVYVDAGACPGIGKNWTDALCYGAGKDGLITLRDGAVVVQTKLVAAIISHGGNGYGGRNQNGTQNPSPPAVLPECGEAYNAPGAPTTGCPVLTNTVFKGEKAEEGGNDDVVATLSATDIFIPLAKQGTVLSATAQAVSDLERLKYVVISSKSACATIPSPAVVLGVDPAGNPYSMSPPDGGACPVTISSTSLAVSVQINKTDLCKYRGTECS